MDRQEAATYFDYVYWMRDRIVEAARTLETSRFTSPETVTIRDLRATLVHELDVEWSWRERLRGANWDEWGPESELVGSSYPDLDAVADHWRQDEAEMRDWAAGFTDETLAAPAPFEKGDAYPLSWYVLHLVMHAVQQFSEAAVLLTRAGHSPGDLGWLEFADARKDTAG
jgi:uncharacterized damage-inducible protein DinB